jgi:hypothetical protein
MLTDANGGSMRALGPMLLLLGCSPESGRPITAADIDALPDRVARLRALEQAVFGGAWTLDELDATCAALRDPEVAAACRRYLGRPHLFRGAAVAARGLAREAEGQPCAAACDGAPSVVDCVVEHALAEGPSGVGCDCLEPALARDECWFRLAEGLRASGGLTVATRATESCLAAGALKGPCLHHQAEFLGGRCAPLDAGNPDGWRDLVQAAADLEASVAHWDAFERQRLVEVVWAGALRCALQRPAPYDPRVVHQLPDAALPHLRAALAWHVVAGLEGEPPRLAAVERQLAELERVGAFGSGGSGSVEIPAGPGDGWAHDAAAWCLAQPGGCPHTALRYFAMGKRLSSGDPSEDRWICLLEAQARLRPDQRAWRMEASAHPSAVVRASGAALDSWLADRDSVSETTGAELRPGR